MNLSPTHHHHLNSVGFMPGVAHSERWDVCLRICMSERIFHYANAWGVLEAVFLLILSFATVLNHDLLWYGVSQQICWVSLCQIRRQILLWHFSDFFQNWIQCHEGQAFMNETADGHSLQINFPPPFVHSWLFRGVVVAYSHPGAVPHQRANTGTQSPPWLLVLTAHLDNND